MVADVTVTRLAGRPVPGRDRRRLPRVGDWPGCGATSTRRRAPSTIRDVSGELATIGLWGPRARDVLVAAEPQRTRSATTALPLRRARAIRVGPAPVARRADQLRGELGWELTTPCRVGGRRVGSRSRRPAPTHRPRAVRLPRARRAADGEGLPLLRHGPDDARHAVRGRARAPSSGSGKGPFIGRDALRRGARGATGRMRRLRTRRSSATPTTLPVYGGEAVRARWRGRRPAPQRRLRPDRRAHDRLRLSLPRTSPRTRR